MRGFLWRSSCGSDQMKVLRVLLARAKRMASSNASWTTPVSRRPPRRSIRASSLPWWRSSTTLTVADRVRLKRLPACSEMELEDLAARGVRTSAGSIYVGDLMTSYREGERSRCALPTPSSCGVCVDVLRLLQVTCILHHGHEHPEMRPKHQLCDSDCMILCLLLGDTPSNMLRGLGTICI